MAQLQEVAGDLGPKYTGTVPYTDEKRLRWKEALDESKILIDEFQALFDSTQSMPEIRNEYFSDIASQPDVNSLFDYDSNSNFTLNEFLTLSSGDAERYIYDPNSVIGKLRLLYLAIKNLGPTDFQFIPGIPPNQNDQPITYDGILKYMDLSRLSVLRFQVEQELEDRREAVEAVIPFTEEELIQIEGPLTDEDLDFITGNNNFQDLFSTTFDINTISLIPLIYNFYLTSEYFVGVSQAFQNPKDRALEIILSTIANDKNFNATANLDRPAAKEAIADSTGQDQLASFNSASRDFILKMLIRTPIDILKGLTELVDPHVAISKVIKTGTGLAFNEAAKAIDSVTPKLNQDIAVATENALEPNINGEDLLSVALCVIDNAIQNAANNENLQAAAADRGVDSIPENFFPRLSIDGIDFTGTVSGMLMMPPGPLGLLYLLLELLKNDVTNQTQNVVDATAENAQSNECSDTPELPDDTNPCADNDTTE